MSLSDNDLYEFGNFRLNVREKHLIHGEDKIPLAPKIFAVLLLLLENSGKLVTKEELMNEVWAESFVEESSLTFTVSQLRKILDDDARRPKFIETVAKGGYRFIAEVKKNQCESVEISPITETTIVELDEKPPSNRKYTAVALGLFIFFTFALSGFIYRATLKTSAANFSKVEFKRVTTDGKAVISTLSPDGKYIVHVKEENGRQGLFVRQTEETKDIEVIPPNIIQFWGLSVSPDNKRIFYTVWEANKSDASLFQVPILGGTPQKVLEIIDTSVSFSPDGNKIAYVRTFNSANVSELVTANADGTEINVLATRKAPETFDVERGSPAWSPDGKMIVAVGATTILGDKCQVIAYDAETGAPTPLTEKNWTIIEQVSWLGNQSGLVMNAGENSHDWKQIWFVSYPDGEAQKITNDLFDYVSVKPSADSKMILTVQREQLTHHSVAPSSDLTNAATILSETGKNGVNEGVAWSPDGKLILRYSQNNEDSLWQIDADGANKKQLTLTDAVQPTVSADGNAIIFSAKNNGNYRLWRMDKDGGNKKLLTNEESENESFANCSAGSNFCVYQRGWKKSAIYKVSLANGEISPLITERQAIRPALSPDSKLFVCFTLDENDVWFLTIVTLDKGEIIKNLPLPETVVSRYMRWTPDGRNLAYVDTKNQVSNIILQPVNGDKPNQITNFTAEEIFYFDWSRDGKQFAISRGTTINNVIAIKNLN